MGRSGMAVGQVAEKINWRADVIYQVGVGLWHQEVEILQGEWPGVEFVSFEPDPRIVKSLKKEGYPGVLYETALGDVVGEVPLYLKSRHKDGSSLYPHKIPGRYAEGPNATKLSTITVKITTLDILLGEPRAGRTLLWLDCEGHELAVLRGGEKFVRGIDVVNVELTGDPPGYGWCKPGDVHQWLAERDFYVQWIHTQRITGAQTDGIYVKRRLFNPEQCPIPHEVVRYRESE